MHRIRSRFQRDGNQHNVREYPHAASQKRPYRNSARYPLTEFHSDS